MKTRIGERVTVNGCPGTITDENERNVCVAFGPALGVRWVLGKHALRVTQEQRTESKGGARILRATKEDGKRGSASHGEGRSMKKKPAKKATTKKTARPYVIVRAHTAGVHAGYLESRDGTDVVLTRSRRLWAWSGGSLSEVATYGPSDKGENKFGAEVLRTTIVSPQGLEIAECSDTAVKAIQAVPEWRR